MNITINPKFLSGEVSIISSKSLSHRYLIAAGLSKGISTIKNVANCDDLAATKQSLLALGVKFDGDMVLGGDLKIINKTIDAKESGTTLRFLIPIAMTFDQEITFIGKNKLPERTIAPYLEIFEQKNLFYSKETDNYLPLVVKGKIKGGLYQFRGDISSQFISGLLFVLPLLKKDSVIELLTPLESKGYVELTLKVLKEFGLHILRVDQYFYIKGGQKYIAQDKIVQGDYSQAAFWMIAGLIGSKIEIKNLDPNSIQGDYKVVSIIKKMQGNIEYKTKKKAYIINPSKTKGITIDLSQIPDLGPILMVLAAVSIGRTTFVKASRLRLKESDRLNAMYDVLTKFGVKISIKNDIVLIKGQVTLKGNQNFDCFNDHRIAMAIAIAAIRADGPVTILNAEAVNKSYPTFFKDYKVLGGSIYES